MQREETARQLYQRTGQKQRRRSCVDSSNTESSQLKCLKYSALDICKVNLALADYSVKIQFVWSSLQKNFKYVHNLLVKVTCHPALTGTWQSEKRETKGFDGMLAPEELHGQLEKRGADTGSWRVLSMSPFMLVTTARQNPPPARAQQARLRSLRLGLVPPQQGVVTSGFRSLQL